MAFVAPLLAATALSAQPEVERLPTRAKVVALTFDGGADAGGAATIVRTLQRRHVPATFFVTGMWARRYPRLARTIGARFDVGDHTYDHAAQTGLSDGDVRRDVARGDYWIRALTRREPRPLFRFPYGDRDSRTLGIVHALGYVSIRWSIDTWGWMGTSGGQSVATVVRRVAERLEPGAILMMHLGAGKDGSMLDARALPQVLSLVERRGHRFVALRRYFR
jgi:peptidoglycan/xylan/chitin deacetylase (PgdA/CDA1 family)